MIPDSGLMVGAYIITRMISFLTRKEEKAESVIVKVFTVITILVTVVSVLDLLTRGAPSTPHWQG